MKTLTDKDEETVSRLPQRATIGWLLSQTAEGRRDHWHRLQLERIQIVLDAVIIGRKVEEEDSDYHLVIADIADMSQTMVAEIPSPDCAGACRSRFREAFRAARKTIAEAIGYPTQRYVHLRVPLRVRITGIPFFDTVHGQTGMASNGVEIHPVLKIELGEISPSP